MIELECLINSSFYLNLSNREYNCKECGYKNPRDYNSVLNILCKSLYINVSKIKLTQGVNQVR